MVSRLNQFMGLMAPSTTNIPPESWAETVPGAKSVSILLQTGLTDRPHSSAATLQRVKPIKGRKHTGERGERCIYGLK